MSTFRGKIETGRRLFFLQQDIYFRNFLENEHTMVLFWKYDHIQLSKWCVLTKYRAIHMDFTFLGRCPI